MTVKWKSSQISQGRATEINSYPQNGLSSLVLMMKFMWKIDTGRHLQSLWGFVKYMITCGPCGKDMKLKKVKLLSKDCWQNSFGFLGTWAAMINSYIQVRSCHIIILLQLLGSWRQQAGKHNVITGSRDYNEGCRPVSPYTQVTMHDNNNNIGKQQ